MYAAILKFKWSTTSHEWSQA